MPEIEDGARYSKIGEEGYFVKGSGVGDIQAGRVMEGLKGRGEERREEGREGEGRGRRGKRGRAGSHIPIKGGARVESREERA